MVDYAEAAPAEVVELIVALDRQSSRRYPARLVPLVRQGTNPQLEPSETPWPWLAGRDARVREYLLSAIAEQSVTALEGTPLSVDERSQLFDLACEAFAGARRRDPPTGATEWLAEDQFGSPLLVSMAALTSVLEGRVTSESATTSELLGTLLDHEARYWAASSLSPELMAEINRSAHPPKRG
jgi:hypothetical protein